VTPNQLGERLPHHLELVVRHTSLRESRNLAQRLDFVRRKTAAPYCRLEKPRRLARLEKIRRMRPRSQLASN
jgi:hypothetical protein